MLHRPCLHCFPDQAVAQSNKTLLGSCHEFTIVSFDEGGEKVGPNGDHRLVCVAESGEKVAIWGSQGNPKNITSILNTGLPCVVRCKTRAPADYAARNYHQIQQ